MGHIAYHWRLSRDAVAQRIESGTEAYYVVDRATGKRLPIGVVREPGHPPHLRTRQGEGWGDQPGIHGEYPRLYSEMARLLASGQSEVDTRPLTLVADAFMLGRRVDVAPFTDPTLKET